jgi:hypothetical protein
MVDLLLKPSGVPEETYDQNYRYDFSTGHITLLTDGKSKNSPGVWSNTGDRIVYGSSRRNGLEREMAAQRQFVHQLADSLGFKLHFEVQHVRFDEFDQRAHFPYAEEPATIDHDVVKCLI